MSEAICLCCKEDFKRAKHSKAIFCGDCRKKSRDIHTGRTYWENLMKLPYVNCLDCGEKFLPNPTFSTRCKPCHYLDINGGKPPKVCEQSCKKHQID